MTTENLIRGIVVLAAFLQLVIMVRQKRSIEPRSARSHIIVVERKQRLQRKKELKIKKAVEAIA
jgi:hypothetical protein